MTPPNVVIDETLDIEALRLRVDSITVLKNEKASANGSALKSVVAYTLNGVEYKTPDLRISLSDGFLGSRFRKQNELSRDFSSFTVVTETSKLYAFLQALHGAFTTYLVDHAPQIQTDILTRFLAKFDSAHASLFTKQNKPEHARIAEKAIEAMSAETLAKYKAEFRDEVMDTFRLVRTEEGDWSQLKPSAKNDGEFILNVNTYASRAEGAGGASEESPYDMKLYTTNPAGQTSVVCDGPTVVDLIGTGVDGTKKGRVEYTRLVLQLKKPFMRSNQKQISFGWCTKFMLLNPLEAEESYDPITDTYSRKRPAAAAAAAESPEPPLLPAKRARGESAPPNSNAAGGGSGNDSEEEEEDDCFD